MNDKEKHIEEDLFLQALIKNDGLKVPSKNFTSMVMSKIPAKQAVVEESSRFIGKNLTLLIFILVGIINMAILYYLWPYISVWIPENSLMEIILESSKIIITEYAQKIFNQSATVSMLLIIGLGAYFIIDKKAIEKNLSKFSKKLSI